MKNIESVVNFSIFFIFMTFFIFFIFNNIKLSNQKRKLTAELIQNKIDLEVLRDEFTIKSTHEYVDFISKSRDEAYEYISQMHESFAEYKKEVSSVIEHFDNFGIVATGNPLYSQMRTLCQSYKKLESAFPKE